ncbi:MAG TPA: hypothetical protein VEY30_06750, partial [Myxococcaceae bacterium]|nr:hypothetical protein [Myxococcaceae bacterium]
MKRRNQILTSSVAFAGAAALAAIVATGTPPPPQVNVEEVNPGTSIARNLCLTVALGPGAASECGDLRLAHSLPAVRTLNRVRQPVLMYSSQHASPRPVVAANVVVEPTGLSRVVAVLKVNGTPRGGGVWRGSSWPQTSGPVRIAVDYDAASDPTGPYRYTLEVKACYGATCTSTSAGGQLVVVNRRDSPFGAGWWLAGLERLVMDPFGKPVLWVGGDGSTRRYTAARGDSVWGAPSLTRPDTLERSGAGWVRLLHGGARVEFDSQGRHTATVGRLGHATEFRYGNAGRLDTIRVPTRVTRVGGMVNVMPRPADPSYAFVYATDGRLQRVDAPGSGGGLRVTTIQRSGARVDSVGDPDRSWVRFAYDSAGSTRIAARRNRLGVETRFRYGAAARVVGARLDLENGDSIVTTLQPLESVGLARVDGKGAVDTAQAYAMIDGPRTDVDDITRLWLNRLGAPRRVVTAVNQESVLAYGDPRYPGLATQSSSGGLVTRAWYDARGRADSTTLYSPYGDGRNATTRYSWDDLWNVPTRVEGPEGQVASFGYDPATGDLLWQQTGAGPSEVDSTRVTYGYDPASRLVTSVLGAGDAQPSKYEYGELGNLSATVTPLGFRTEYHADALGRDTLVTTPTDAAQTAAYRATIRTWYDAAGRDSLTRTHGPSLGDRFTGARTLWVEKLYSREGQARSVRRWGEPRVSPDHPTQYVRRFEYDAAGRDTAEYDEVDRPAKRR